MSAVTAATAVASQPKRMLVDFDSTITLFQEAKIQACNKRFGTDYRLEQTTSWDFWESTPKEHYAFVWSEQVYQNFFWTLDVPPRPYALSALDLFQEEGYSIVVVSDRRESMRPWIQAYLAKYGFEDVDVVTSNRQRYPKWKVALDCELDIAVEDSPHNALDLAQIVDQVYLIDCPWNRDVEDPRITRVNDWLQIIDYEL